MGQLRLTSLSLRNFKGVKDFTLDIGGQDAEVIAQNKCGKTTLRDSVNWLLFGKDSKNKATFSIKTLDENNEPLHGLEHEVEGVFDLDGKQVTFRRLYKETWTQKRGSARKEHTGHTTDYFMDDVPVSEKEYKEKVAGICDETVFRLLTDLTFFNTVMKWEDRRRLLLDVCGDISDADVIASDEKLARLPEILESRSIDEHRKQIAAAQKKINEELKSIPTRIDEVERGTPEVSGDATAVESGLKKARAEVQEKHQERARIEAGGQVAEKKRRLAELEAELQAHRNKVRDEADGINLLAKDAARKKADETDDLKRRIASAKQDIESNAVKIKRLEKEMDNLRAQWQEANDLIFDNDLSLEQTVCAACGQDLPAERVQEARDKALAAFNVDKAGKLERIDGFGKQAKTEAANLALLNERARKEISSMETEQVELEALDPALELVEPDLSYPPLEAEIAGLRAEIAQLAEGNTAALAAVEDEIRGLQQQINDGEAALAAFAQIVEDNQRIEALKAEEEALAAQYERLESELFLTEEFIRAKVSMLEEKINAKFKLARFQLFETQINEGIKEKCVTLIGGVPWPDLNTGSEIHGGLDIISTLAEHYGFAAFVFVDNAESITDEIKAPGQLIKLIAKRGVKKLTVETKKTALKEAVV